ncbi:AraC family transcriptional regulator [Victivallis sp. Marseille-Q1083]|uniref:helix-turn-helix transcriptional regulator n=1 Tax=Victivallis sp. Marseille-Q1083 TaxID=2717288 RepID=UPI00158AAF2E|nr:AraC family transcriptional regulator [Victivallis sp. Marseille-Q1083]
MSETSAIPSLLFSHAGIGAGKAFFGGHNHDGTELVFVRRGHCESVFSREQNSRESLRLTAGVHDLYVIPPRLYHNQINLETTETLYLVFQASRELFDSTLRIIHVTDELVENWLELIVRLDDELQFEQCRGLLYALLNRLKEAERSQRADDRFPPQLNRALAFIERNLADGELSQKEIARSAVISVSYLKKLFLHRLGTSPMTYVQDLRMYRARQLLRNRYLFISEVGVKCGYPSANYFSRVFRRHHNISPEEFRRYLDTGVEREDDQPQHFI